MKVIDLFLHGVDEAFEDAHHLFSTHGSAGLLAGLGCPHHAGCVC